jgi:hypothetical protein
METVRIKVLTSFNGLQAGTLGTVEYTEHVQAYERAGLVEVDHGQSEDRPGRDHARDPGGEHAGAAGGGADGDGASEGFGTSGYGETPREHRAP